MSHKICPASIYHLQLGPFFTNSLNVFLRLTGQSLNVSFVKYPNNSSLGNLTDIPKICFKFATYQKMFYNVLTGDYGQVFILLQIFATKTI